VGHYFQSNPRTFTARLATLISNLVLYILDFLVTFMLLPPCVL